MGRDLGRLIPLLNQHRPLVVRIGNLAFWYDGETIKVEVLDANVGRKGSSREQMQKMRDAKQRKREAKGDERKAASEVD